MIHKDDTLVIRADVPGMKPEDLAVTVEDDVLTIRGHREEEKEVKEEDYYCAERATGEFVRKVRLPEGVTADQVEAHRENGVLEVTIPAPKAAESKAVKIPVK
jgi:HSP20 family protein